MKKLLAALLTAALLLSLCTALAETPSVSIVVAGTFGDRSFYDSANEGIQRLAADFGTKIYASEMYSDASQAENKLFDSAEVADITAAVGWEFGDALSSTNGVLQAFPDKKFLFIDTALEVIPENLMCITYAQNEGSFLVGYIAGKMSTTGKIGVVGGEDADTINDFIVGYEAGALLANPNVTVMRQYANTYEDPAKGKDCALALYDSGCDIVYAVAGKTGEGVFEAAAEKDGRYAIGVDSDQKWINDKVIICSMIKQVGQSIYDVVANPDRFVGGTEWHTGMADGFIEVGYGTPEMTQQVSDELKAEVETIKAQIVSGEIVVPTVFH